MAPPTPVRSAFTPGPCMAQALYRLNVRQFQRMLDNGTIADEERIELIEGLLVSKPKRSRASIVVGNKGLRILWRMIPPGWHVAKGVPIVLSDWSRPEPDLALIRGVVDDYDEREATADETAMVVEIAEANLPADMADMTRVYAAAGIPVCWIINLLEGQVEVFADPRRDGYQSHQVLARGQDVPIVIGGVEVAWIAVSDVLP